MPKKKLFKKKDYQIMFNGSNCDRKLKLTGSLSTFEFPSRVNLYGPSLYCIAWTLGKKSRHSIGLAGATRVTRSDFRLNFLLVKG